MKKTNRMLIVINLIAVLMGFQASGQSENEKEEAFKNNVAFPVGLGATFIDGEMYYLLNLMPELEFGNLGIGLDINLRINEEGKIRKGDYVKFRDYLRIIRYVRWAQKGEPFYVRVGQLDYSLLGHGSIVYNYRNTASYDLRKVGMELDLNFEKLGFESIYSDFSEKGLFGIRGYLKPLKFTNLAKLPVINNFEIGGTIAVDFHDKANITRWDSSGKALTIVGLDLGIPILSYRIIKSIIYADYAKILDYGHGSAIGVNALFSGFGGVTLRGKYELRFNSVKFIPAYFNGLYELERYNSQTNRSKSDSLITVPASNGYFGELTVSILNTFEIIAGYQEPFKSKNEGVLHAELKLPEVSGFLIRAGYDKAKIGKVFMFDEYSILSAEVGYKPFPFLMVSTLYQRTFSDRDANGNQLDHFVPQDRVEPKVSIIFEF